MRVLTKKQALERVQAYVARYISQAEAARKAGITQAQLSDCLADKKPIPTKLLKKLRIERVPVYVVGEDIDNYRDGSLVL